jgi:hypothetical protein
MVVGAQKMVYPVHVTTRKSFGLMTRNAVRLQLHALTYNLANFMRTLARGAGKPNGGAAGSENAYH